MYPPPQPADANMSISPGPSTLLPTNTLVFATFSTCCRILSSFWEFVSWWKGENQLEQGWRMREAKEAWREGDELQHVGGRAIVHVCAL